MTTKTTRTSLLLLLLLMLVPAGVPARAQDDEPLVTDRPDFTESAVTVPAGRTQAEFGLTVTRARPVRETSFGELLLRIGFSPRAELRVGVPSYTETRGGGERASGLADSSLGVKLQIGQAGEGTGLRTWDSAVILQTSLPTGSDEHGEDDLQPGVKLLLSSALTQSVTFSTNLNYDRVSEEGEKYGEFSNSLSFGFPLTEKLGSYIEYFGFFPSGSGRENTYYVNGGLTYLVNNDLQWDARIGKGLNGIEDDWFFGFGGARRF